MTQYAHPETLVDTQWLVKHLNDPNIRIVEIDFSSESYEREHIPGSIFWNAMAPFKPNLQINFDSTAMEKLLGDLGIDNKTTIIAVHNSYIATSGFIFWLLKVFGHDDVRILNGGRKKWVMDNYSLTEEKTIVKPTQYHVRAIDRDLEISLSEVQKLIQQNDGALLDVRTPQEYHGELYLMESPKENERGGHIPSATNLYYEIFHNEDDTFKSFAEIQEIFEQKNITPEQLIVPYCAVGGRSGHTWFILKYLLGYPNVKNYHRSWNEWSRITDLPVAK